VKPDIYDSFDSFDRAALRSAQTIAVLAADIEGLYKMGVELNDPTPPGPSIEQGRGGGDVNDPTGRLGTSQRRYERSEQLEVARKSLTEALKHTRKALHAAARASTP
jgi:hypothetical protein